MAVIWITGSDLGTYAVGHDFTASPISLVYSASSPKAKVSLVSGSIPLGLTADTSVPGFVTLRGIVSQLAYAGANQSTWRATDIDGTSADQVFTMMITSGPVPAWDTPADLGTFTETHSFNLEPLSLRFGAESGATVALINGSLPSGLSWTRVGDTISISGESAAISDTVLGSFTFRIRNTNGTVADRTFRLTITPEPVLPSWERQPTFLGYVASGSQGRFKVTATVPGTTPPLYGISYSLDPRFSMDGAAGVLSYAAGDEPYNVSKSCTISATSAGGTATLGCSIIVVALDSQPMWITTSDTQVMPRGTTLELRLEAFDPQGRIVVYSIASADPGFPFALDPDGLLYGEAPMVDQDTTWSATFTAEILDHPAISSDLSIEFKVTRTNTAGTLTWRSATTDWPSIPCGQPATYDIGATSTRTPTVLHGIVGGQVPLGLLLDKVQGRLTGFVEYHPIDKDYWFDIKATDGVDTMHRTIHMRVQATLPYQFADLSMPLTGDVRDAWIRTTNALLSDPQNIANVSVESNQFLAPSMSIIRGLDHTADYMETLMARVSGQLQQLRLGIGPSGLALTGDQGDMLLYREVMDPQVGAAGSASHQGSPPTILPPSLVNIRTAFAGAMGFASAGGGSGAAGIARINPEDGSITAILITAEGSGYINSPQVIISGSGTGAIAAARTCVQEATVRDRGSGWTIGQRFHLEVGSYERPAELVVIGVDPTGALKQVMIADGGVYHRMPVGKINITDGASALAAITLDLGVCDVVITAGGTGYGSDTVVSFGGTEMLDGWQAAWSPVLPMARIAPGRANAVIASDTASVSALLDGQIWQADTAVLEMQGMYWQGSTTFDGGETTWDGGTTRCEETLEPRETILDHGLLTFDQSATALDRGPNTPRDARDNWGLTTIDGGMTAFEYYATIFDAVPETTRRESGTIVRRVVHLTQPQVSGNNITNDI